MYELLTHDKQIFSFWPLLKDDHDKVILFGAGGRGRDFAAFLKDNAVEVVCFLDNDTGKHGTKVDGIDVKSPDDPSLAGTALPVVISCHARGMVYLQLASKFDNVYYDFNSIEHLVYVAQVVGLKDSVKRDMALLADDESVKSYLGTAIEVYSDDMSYRYRSKYRYLKHPKVHIEPGDTVLAIGANTGSYYGTLCADVDGDCSIHCLEPNYLYFARLCNNIYNSEYRDQATVLCAGMWSSTGMQMFSDPFDMALGRISNGTGQQAIYSWSLDDYVAQSGIKPDLIEVERASLGEALIKGGEKTIKKYKPRLILKICPGTFDEIQMLHDLVPEYTFYYGDHDLGTKKSMVGFLYAIVE